MSPILPFDIISLIIDIVAEKDDTNLLKELALVSHCFHQICSKHLFADIELYEANPSLDIGSSKKGFVKLLKSRPDVVNYIRELRYTVNNVNYDVQLPPKHGSVNNEDHLLSSILPNLLRTIPRLNCLMIISSHDSPFDWNELDSSLKSAFLHLIHLPTINHIDLSYI